MARVSSEGRTTVAERRGGREHGAWLRAAGFAAAAGGVVLAVYLAHPLAQGWGLPVGPDGPVYTWRTQLAAAMGLGAAPGSRPGVHGLILTLGGALGTTPLQTVALLGPVLAASAGLAAASLLEAAIGPSLSRAWAATLLTAAWASYLAGGWLANMTQTAVLLGTLAVLAMATGSWRAVAAGGAMVAAAGLSHGLLLAWGLAVLVATAVAHVPDALRHRRAGGRVRDTAAFRLSAAAAVGGGMAWAALLPSLGAVHVPGDTAQDGFFRRLGLRPLLVDRYRERLAGDLGRAAGPILAGAALTAPTILPGGPRGPGPRYVLRLCLSWAALTSVAIVVLALSGLGPANRILAAAFFLPIAAAVGFGTAVRGRAPELVVGAVVAGLVFVAVGMYGWYRQFPATAVSELDAAGRAGAVAAALPPDRPVLFLVDTDEPAAAFHVTRFANVIRTGLPPERIPLSRVVVGTPEDLLERRPTLTGDFEHDRLAEAYLREAEPVLDRAAVLVLEVFNPRGYDGALDRGREAAPGVVLLDGPRRLGALQEEVPPTRPLSPAALVALSLSALALLGLLGAGWARLAIPGAGPRAVMALAPSVGVAVTVLVSVVVDVAGARAGGGISLFSVAAAAGVGHALAARAR